MLSLRDLQKLDDKLPELGNGEDAADGWDCGTKQVWKLYRVDLFSLGDKPRHWSDKLSVLQNQKPES